MLFSFAAIEGGTVALSGDDALPWELATLIRPAEVFRASSTTGMWLREVPYTGDVETELLQLKEDGQVMGMDDRQRSILLSIMFARDEKLDTS